MARLVGIDVGTTACKALAIDDRGAILGSASAEYPLLVPRPKWTEQEPDDWWRAVRTCLQALGPERPDAIGLTGQMHGAVFLDGEGRSVRPAILWNDQRTVAEVEEIDAVLGAARVREVTCNPPITGFQAPKILWLRRHEPERYAKVRSVLLPKDFIRLRLTGQFASDASDASGTGLFDVARRAWARDLIEGLDLDPGLFPEVKESWEVTGHTPEGVPVVAGAGDQAASAVGTGAVELGVLSVSLGTSGVVFSALDSPEYDPAGSAHTFCHANGRWHAMGVTLACGGSLKWFRGIVGTEWSYDALMEAAAGVAPGAKGLTFLPYLSGERCPHNDPSATGVFSGLTLAHGRAELARAVVEGATFGLRDALDLLVRLGASTRTVRVTGGGARSRQWVQMVSDVFEAPCATLEGDEGPAMGAAMLAGVGIGVWPDVADASRACVRERWRVEPSGADYSEPLAAFRALYPRVRGR